MTGPKIEVLTVRDPDGGTYVTMFVDGVKTDDYTEYDVDAGAGHMRSEWDEESRDIEADPDLTPAFKAAVLAARENPPGSKYIEDDRVPPRDVAWALLKENELVALWEDYVNLHENEKDRLDMFACEQVSRLLVTKLKAEGWDAWLFHGQDPQSVDGLLGDHYWVGVDDDGMVEHFDATYQQFANVADPAVALAVDGAGGEWPLQWHTWPDSPRHPIVTFATITKVD